MQTTAYLPLSLEEKNHEESKQTEPGGPHHYSCWGHLLEATAVSHPGREASPGYGQQGPHQPGARPGWQFPLLGGGPCGTPTAPINSPFSSLFGNCRETRALTKPSCSSRATGRGEGSTALGCPLLPQQCRAGSVLSCWRLRRLGGY